MKKDFLKNRKAELQKEYDEVKKKGQMHESVMLNARKELDKTIADLNRISGAFKEIDLLQKQMKK